MTKQKAFTKEFADEAVRLALTSGRTRRELAENLGVGLSTLTQWIRPVTRVGPPTTCGGVTLGLRSFMRACTASNVAWSMIAGTETGMTMPFGVG